MKTTIKKSPFDQVSSMMTIGCFLLMSTVQAAEQRALFAVSSQQLQALDIQTFTLANQTSSDQSSTVRKSYPAQVIAPANAEQIISSPVAGLVQQLLVQLNQRVSVGTPLIRVTSPELGQLQLQLLQATTQATLARQTAQREQQLFAEGIIPKRRVQEADASLKQAEASLQYAKAALKLSGMSSSAMAQVVRSGNLQDGITLTAAKAGVISEVSVKSGQRVESATDLIHITQTGSYWLDIQIPVAESVNWKVGTKLSVQGRDSITGRILSISPSASTRSQTISARAALEGTTEQIRLGEFLTVSLPINTVAGGWGLPLTSVAYQNNNAYVFVRTQTGFEAKPVKVIASAAQRVQVQGALKAGDRIAVTSVVALKGAWLNPKESQ